MRWPYFRMIASSLLGILSIIFTHFSALKLFHISIFFSLTSYNELNSYLHKSCRMILHEFSIAYTSSILTAWSSISIRSGVFSCTNSVTARVRWIRDVSSYEFNSLHDVKEKNIDIWKSFSAEKCVKMIDSIPRRLEAIIRKQGQRITKRDCWYFYEKFFFISIFLKKCNMKISTQDE